MTDRSLVSVQSHTFEYGNSREDHTLEHWAMNRAHQIVVHQGMKLVEAAQCLDHKQTNASTYALRKAIMDCLVEALRQGSPASLMAAE